ncbi:MAG: glycosyltransferase family 2 protein [Methanomassiliicoccales archaeon]
MSSTDEVVTVIPAFNEEVSIGSVILGAKRHSESVVVVDDGSWDRTAELARMAGAEVIRFEENMGKAHALKKGLEYADTKGFRAVVTMDGDGQHDHRDIADLVKPVLEGEADLVIGSRFLNGGNGIPSYRKAGQKVLNRLTNLACRREVTDTQSGFRVLSRTALEHLDFSSEGYSIESDMICHFIDRGLRVEERPISANYGVPNKHKKNPLSHGLSLMGRVIKVVSQNRPLLLIGVPGFAMVLLGFFLGTVSLMEITLFQWGWLFQTLMGAFVFTIGFVMIISALVLNSISDLLGRIKRETVRGNRFEIRKGRNN